MPELYVDVKGCGRGGETLDRQAERRRPAVLLDDITVAACTPGSSAARAVERLRQPPAGDRLTGQNVPLFLFMPSIMCGKDRETIKPVRGPGGVGRMSRQVDLTSHQSVCFRGQWLPRSGAAALPAKAGALSLHARAVAVEHEPAAARR